MRGGGVTRRAALALLGAAAPAAAVAVIRSGSGIWLIDPSAVGAAGLPAIPKTNIVPLGRHVVRQWRDDIEVTIRERGGAAAIVRWDNALLLSGLAREAGYKGIVHQIRPGIFRVDIRV